MTPWLPIVLCTGAPINQLTTWPLLNDGTLSLAMHYRQYTRQLNVEYKCTFTCLSHDGLQWMTLCCNIPACLMACLLTLCLPIKGWHKCASSSQQFSPCNHKGMHTKLSPLCSAEMGFPPHSSLSIPLNNYHNLTQKLILSLEADCWKQYLQN